MSPPDIALGGSAGDKTRFATLHREWLDLVLAAKQRQLASWSAAMAVMLSADAELRATGRWTHGRADTLGILRRHRMELDHSAMLAWLLTPTGHHRLGTRFLERVLDRCAPSARAAGLARARVACEVTRNDVRVDVLVRTEQLTLIIENKVDAAEGPSQCADMVRQFGSDPGACFVFLTPTGRAPTTDPAGRFVPLSFRTVRSDLEVLASALEPGVPGTAVLLDYLHTLRIEFP